MVASVCRQEQAEVKVNPQISQGARPHDGTHGIPGFSPRNGNHQEPYMSEKWVPVLLSGGIHLGKLPASGQPVALRWILPRA
jgi:hypothetical protein